MKNKSSKVSENDQRLFRDAMADVEQLHLETVNIRRKRTLTSSKPICKTIEQSEIIDYGETYYEDISAEESLFYQQPHVPTRTISKLKRGQLPIIEEIDLHRFNRSQVSDQLDTCLKSIKTNSNHCLLIVTGKGGGITGSVAILKSFVNHYLINHPRVLAFCSAQRKHGGTGALYVILKAKMKNN